MKAINIFVCAMALCVLKPLQGEDECCASEGVKVEQRLKEIDLKVMLDGYEQLRTAVMQLEIKLKMLQGEPADEQRQALLTRLEYLRHETAELRGEILALGKTVSVAAK